MPYADRDRQRAAARESARRRRLARQGATSIRVEPSNPGPSVALTPCDLLAILAEELTSLRRNTKPGDGERCRIVAQLVTVALRAYEAADLVGRVEHLERMFAGLDENGRRTIHAV